MKSIINKLIIFGSGLHAKLCFNEAQKIYKIKKVFFFNNINKIKEISILKKKFIVINSFYELEKHVDKKTFFFIGVGNCVIREKIHIQIKSRFNQNNYLKIISKKANIDKTTKIGIGSLVMPGASINFNSKVGDHCIINTNCSIDHDCSLLNFINIGPGASIAGNVCIKNKCNLGIGSNIVQNIKINENCIIGAGALVNKNCKKNGTYYGVPAKFKKKIMTFIIAEIGVNHNNDLKISKKIIDFCSDNGVNAVKFQTFNANKLALKNTPKVNYQKKNKFDTENHFQMLKKLELSKKDHVILKKYCEIKGIEFISTPYDIDSAKFLIDLNINTIKVASADLTDHYLHEFLSKSKKNLILSTGMSNLNDIQNTLKIYKNRNHKKISLLHCVSSYPSPIECLNLNCIDTLKRFNLPVGFSDHSKENLPSVIAVAKGAQILEKHITLNNNYQGPDHKTSLNLKDFKSFVNIVRRTEKILGKNIKRIQLEEREMLNISKKSLYYKKNFNVGHKIKKNDMMPMRPFTGLEISKYKEILNKKILKKVKKNQKVSKDDFKK